MLLYGCKYNIQIGVDMQSNFRVFLVDSSEDPPRIVGKLPGFPDDQESALRLGMIAVKTFVVQLDLGEDFVSVYLINREVDTGLGKVPGTWIKIEELPFGSFVEGVELKEDKAGPYYRNTEDFGKEITIDGEPIFLMPPITEEDN